MLHGNIDTLDENVQKLIYKQKNTYFKLKYLGMIFKHKILQTQNIFKQGILQNSGFDGTINICFIPAILLPCNQCCWDRLWIHCDPAREVYFEHSISLDDSWVTIYSLFTKYIYIYIEEYKVHKYKSDPRFIQRCSSKYTVYTVP